MVLSLKAWKSRSLPGLPRTEFPSSRCNDLRNGRQRWRPSTFQKAAAVPPRRLFRARSTLPVTGRPFRIEQRRPAVGTMPKLVRRRSGRSARVRLPGNCGRGQSACCGVIGLAVMLLRTGSTTAIIGALALLIATMLHPMTADLGDPVAAFTEYAADRWWIASHLGQFLGGARMFVGM